MPRTLQTSVTQANSMKKFLILIFWPFVAIAADTGAPANDAGLSKLTLSGAEQLWQARNREIQLARDQVAGVAADRLGAAQRPNPQLSLNTGAIDTGRNAPALGRRVLHDSDMVLRLDQTFERGGKRELRMRAADLRLDAAKHDMADIARQSRIALHQAYYNLALAQEKLRITQENARLSGQTVEATRLRLSAGDVPASDLSRIRVDALRADNDVLQARNDLSQAQTALAYQIGAGQNAASIVAVDAWPAIGTFPAEGMGIENRPDVRAAQMRVQTAEAARDLAQSLKTRDVTLGVQVEHNGSSTPSHSVGFGLSIPLMTGYEYQGEIGRAEANLQSARDALEQTRAQAMTEIGRARSNLETAISQVRRYDDSLLAEAGKALGAAEFAYRHGAIGVMDMLDARRTHKATQMDAAAARADYAKALAAWRFANEEGELQ